MFSKRTHSLSNTQLQLALLNFNALINHSKDHLILQNGLLKTATTAGDKKAVDRCATQTYEMILILFSLSLAELNALDVDLCLRLMQTLDKWVGDSSKKPMCAEQAKLFNFLQLNHETLSKLDESSHQHSIDQSKTAIKADSFNELFELKPSDAGVKKRPSFLLITADEWRTLRGYEGGNVKKYYASLPGENAIAQEGIRLTRHHTSATACVPSRAVLYTGQHQHLHGMYQTDGGAKIKTDSHMRYLDPDVPTLGSYFEMAGYDTFYSGKWHLSPEDILDDHAHIKPIKPMDGQVDEHLKKQYLQKDPLAKFGFHGFVGPEPHGASIDNAGVNRDPLYTRDVCSWLIKRNEQAEDRPFFIALNLVNPHDIVLIPALWLYYAAKYNLPKPDSDITQTVLPPSMMDNLSDKPSVQKAYRERYSKMFCINPINGSEASPFKDWNWFNHYYQRMYWTLVKLADQHIKMVYDTLKSTRFFDNTYVVLTSDHGDLTGAHQMIQKWYNAYDETVNIPLVISHPHLKHKGKHYDGLTSHLSLLPTLLRLAGLNPHQLTDQLKIKHKEAHYLPGHVIGDRVDYSAINTKDYRILESVYFLTADDVMAGDTSYTALAQMYPKLKNIPLMSTVERIKGNTYIEMVSARVEINQQIHHFKYVYYQSPDPTSAMKPEEEFYNLLDDRYELKNLVKEAKLTPTEAIALTAMKKLLLHERQLKLVKPYDPDFLKRPQAVTLGVHTGPGSDFLVGLAVPPVLAITGLAAAGCTLYSKVAPKIHSAATEVGRRIFSKL